MTLPDDPRAAAGDAALRALYREAGDRISTGTTARLHHVRHAAIESASTPRRGWAWPVAAGCAALFALAIGVQSLTPDPHPAPNAGTTPLAAADDAVLAEGAVDALATYEESPDFYLWLAANETTLLAME